MPNPPYETAAQRKENRYRQFLSSAKAKHILDAYSEAGGDTSVLREVLWGLREDPYDADVVPDLRTLQAMQRLLRGLEAIPDMRRLEAIDESLWGRVQAFTDVKPMLQAYLKYLPRRQHDYEWDLMWKRQCRSWRNSPEGKAAAALLKNPPPRWARRIAEAKLKHPFRREHTPKTLMAAALVEEFRLRFRQPRYRQAACLLREALPDEDNGFGKLTDAKLGRLVRRVPPDITKREHTIYFHRESEVPSIFDLEEPRF